MHQSMTGMTGMKCTRGVSMHNTAAVEYHSSTTALLLYDTTETASRLLFFLFSLENKANGTDLGTPWQNKQGWGSASQCRSCASVCVLQRLDILFLGTTSIDNITIDIIILELK